MRLIKKILNHLKAFIIVWGKMYRAVFNTEKNKSTIDKVRQRLNKAIKEADDKHTINGKRYYVLPYDTKDPKFVVLNRAEIKVAQKRGIINRKLDIVQVLNLCRYMTK